MKLHSPLVLLIRLYEEGLCSLLHEDSQGHHRIQHEVTKEGNKEHAARDLFSLVETYVEINEPYMYNLNQAATTSEKTTSK